jgi:hypothetical protein
LKDDVRAARARQLLHRTARPIKQIAAACGFANEKSFIRAPPGFRSATVHAAKLKIGAIPTKEPSMKSRNTAQFLAAAALALVGFGAASTAQAGSDLYFSIGVQAPGYYSEPAPVYVQPRSYYVQPQPVYGQPQPVYVQPRPIYIQPQPVYLPRIQSAPVVVYQDRWNYEQERRAAEWRHWNRKQHHHHGRDRDWDRDED